MLVAVKPMTKLRYVSITFTGRFKHNYTYIGWKQYGDMIKKHPNVLMRANYTALCGLYITAYAVLVIKQHIECKHTDDRAFSCVIRY